MSETSGAPVTGLDPARIGEIMIRLPAIAASLRHASLKSSLGYLHPVSGDGDPELEFVRAMLTERLGVVHDEWYGGSLNASRMSADLMDQVHERLQARVQA